MIVSHFFYAENVERSSPVAGYERWDACKQWAIHRYNQVVLQHISSATKDAREKMQAENEILIAVRKCKWWSLHPNFNQQGALARLKADFGI